MYIDAAYFLFRQLNPDVTCVVSSPCFSVQKGSRSSLASRRWFEKFALASAAVDLAREIRDEVWRQGWLRIDGPKVPPSEEVKITSGPPEIWPSPATVTAENRESVVNS